MKKILLLFILFTNFLSAQQTEVDSIISKELKQLKENGIDRFFFLQKFCVGCNETVTANKVECELKYYQLYLFWQENNKSYFRKIEKCNSKKIKISGNFINKFYIQNVDIIKNENVKEYQIGKDEYIMVDHSSFSKFYFFIDGKLITKQIDYFNLESQETPNINYEFNNSLKLVKLNAECSKIIRENK